MENKNQFGQEKAEEETEHIANILNETKRKKGILYTDIGESLRKLGIIPQYTENNLFLITVTFLLFLIFDPSLRYKILKLVSDSGGIDAPITAFFTVAAMVMSVYYVFSKGIMSKGEKSIMLLYAVYANALAGICAGAYVLEQSGGVMSIFPILNIASGTLLLSLFKYDIIDESSILDVHPRRQELISGIILVCLIFFISHFIFNNYWAITFSFCVFYATNLSEFISKNIFKNKDVFNEA